MLYSDLSYTEVIPNTIISRYFRREAFQDVDVNVDHKVWQDGSWQLKKLTVYRTKGKILHRNGRLAFLHVSC